MRLDKFAHDLLPLLRKLHIEEQAYRQYENLGRLSANYKSRINNQIVDVTFRSARQKEIIVGPFHSEIGFEILYWIPFLRWAFKKYAINPEQVTVVSRGGAESWYRGLAGNYVDIFSFITPDQLRKYNEQRVSQRRTHKQNIVETFERDILEKVMVGDAPNGWSLVHPMLMYRQFAPFWSYATPITSIDRSTCYVLSPPLPKDDLIESLPKDYVAVKFYFSASFPATPENKQFVADCIARLSKRRPVVLLSTGLSIDDHAEATTSSANVIEIKDHITPENNIDVQTRILSNAKAFVGTYGGFSYIAPFYGVPSLAYYSREDKFLPTHLEVALRAYRKIKHGAFSGTVRGHARPKKGHPELLVLGTDQANIFADAL